MRASTPSGPVLLLHKEEIDHLAKFPIGEDGIGRVEFPIAHIAAARVEIDSPRHRAEIEVKPVYVVLIYRLRATVKEEVVQGLRRRAGTPGRGI